ncbi:DoxX family protein [Aureisphaera galaxeae]|uniref:DoxX family protein n=1 Tax=Aureisphaera galaxeae TaxID=1538023 RepID=UPI002350EA3F|nr:DoxX family protein [Aureisphaera galaxeae]MDC8004163.1 DoxX family protein [Aureisphaera galaxeae]
MPAKTIYWISTLLVSAMLLWSSYSYIFSESTIQGIRDLGFPDFFRIQLAVLKLLAVLILVVPQIPLTVKEWAYAGVGLFFITAIVAHFAHKDPIAINLINVVFIGLLIVSRIYLHKLS